MGNSYQVFPAGPLEGEIQIQGAKNSVLKLMAATLLAEGTHEITNVPDITDVHDMANLLRSIGVKVEFDRNRLLIKVPEFVDTCLPEQLVKKMRASIVLIGPLTARFRSVKTVMPGGDDFGSRPINFHVKGLEAMGATVAYSQGIIQTAAPEDGLKGSRFVLEYPSHTATDNLMMAASVAEGTTIIENAAREPEVVDLANFLNSMGARIQGAGTSHLKIKGVTKLSPSKAHRLIPDRVEAATFLAAVGITTGKVTLCDANSAHLDTLIYKLQEMGLEIKSKPGSIVASFTGKINPVDVVTLPYPGVATDYKPFLVTMLALGQGAAVVTENVFGAGRFRYIDELNKLGANIVQEGHHALIRGVDRFIGTEVVATDVRGGAALVLAALRATGISIIRDIYHIKRGYSDFASKLNSLGANVNEIA